MLAALLVACTVVACNGGEAPHPLTVPPTSYPSTAGPPTNLTPVPRPKFPNAVPPDYAAVNQAVADSEARHEQRLEQLAVAYDEMLDYSKRHDLVVKRAGYVQAGGDFR